MLGVGRSPHPAGVRGVVSVTLNETHRRSVCFQLGRGKRWNPRDKFKSHPQRGKERERVE